MNIPSDPELDQYKREYEKQTNKQTIWNLGFTELDRI